MHSKSFFFFTLMPQLSNIPCKKGKQQISKEWRKNCHKKQLKQTKKSDHFSME